MTEDGRAEHPGGATDTVAGLMAAGSIFISAIGLVQTPVKLLPASMVLALIAAGIGGRHKRLAAFAVGVAFVCWIAGMTIAIATERDLY